MGLRIQKRTMELLYQLMDGKTTVTPFVEYQPQKILYEDQGGKKEFLPRSTPESQGISSGYLRDFLQEIEQNTRIHVHGIMVVRNGYVVAEASSYPYFKQVWHATYSLCKSITGLAIGMLIDEGKLKLEDKVTDILDSYVNPLTAFRHKSLTIRHLLTMSSGSMFNEVGAVTENDWIKAYLESNNRFSHGSQFAYNSMNSYLLSAIVTKITGEKMMEYLTPRLWEPLHIDQVYWEVCPCGINKGGWGLYLTLEDMAKIGQMVMQKGMWHETRIISEDWIQEAVKKQIDTGEKNGYGYGYHNWVSETENSYQFNGMLGQNVISYPDKNMIIVTTAGDDELFMLCALMDVIKKYFGGKYMPKGTLEEAPLHYQELIKYEEGLGRHQEPALSGIRKGGWKHKNSIKKRNHCFRHRTNRQRDFRLQCQTFVGKKYEINSNRGMLMPVFLQLVHNNYSKGIKGIEFEQTRDGMIMKVTEGETIYPIQIGFGKVKYQKLLYHGEPYLLGVEARFGENEEGMRMLRLDIHFIETPHTRVIKIFSYDEERILISLNEMPGTQLIKDALDNVIPADKGKFFQDFLTKLDPDFFHYKLQKAIEPWILGIRKDKKKQENKE